MLFAQVGVEGGGRMKGEEGERGGGRGDAPFVLPPKSPPPRDDSNYLVPMIMLFVLCLAAAITSVVCAVAMRADVDRLSARLSSLEGSRSCRTPEENSNQPIQKTDDNSPRLPDRVAEGLKLGGQEVYNGVAIGDGSSGSQDHPMWLNQHSSSYQSWFLTPKVERHNYKRGYLLPDDLLRHHRKRMESSDESSDLEEAPKRDSTEENRYLLKQNNLLNQFRTRFKRSLPQNQEFTNEDEIEDVSRPERRRGGGGGRRRGGAREDPVLRGGHRMTGTSPILALHFDGNTSKYSPGHRHFAGNGRVRHPDGIFRDWRMKEWSSRFSRQHRLQENDSTLTIRESGIYFVYAQVYYLDNHDINGFQVMVNNSPVLQCATMTQGGGHTKANTCFTGGMIELHAGDNILLRDGDTMRYSIFEPEKTFFGLFRVAHQPSGAREGP